MRKPIIAGNWKMNKTIGEARQFAREFLPLVSGAQGQAVEIVLCPSFTALAALGEELKESVVGLGAQDFFWEPSGAFTGEVSLPMLVDAGCRYVIIGHSERRQYFGETNESVNRKAKAALAAGLTPIICVGESLSQREAGETAHFVEGQVRGGLAGITPGDAARLIIAYEPIWAIGTGRNASGSDAQSVCQLIRDTVRDLCGGEAAASIRVQYGGSVKPGNIAEFMREPDVDGALVGGASLEASGFARLIEEAGK